LWVVAAVETKGVFFSYDAMCIVKNIDEVNKFVPKNDYDNVSVDAEK